MPSSSSPSPDSVPAARSPETTGELPNAVGDSAHGSAALGSTSSDGTARGDTARGDTTRGDIGRPIAWMALVGFSLAAFMLLVPLPLKSRIGSAIGDLAHAPMFGGIFIAILLLWHRVSPLDQFGRAWLGRIALVTLCVFILGILVELAQTLTGRKAASHDVVANGLGILAAGMLCIAVLNYRYQPRRIWLSGLAALLAIGLVGIALTRPVRIIWDVLSVHRAYPSISSFERDWEMTRWHFDDCGGQIVSTHATDGSHAMRWSVRATEHPAATLVETVTDWSDAQSFEVDVTLAPTYPGIGGLYVKVIDHDHADYHEDVCRKQFLLTPGKTQHLVISREEIINGPDTRKLDLSNVKLVSLMLYRPEVPTWIDVDNLRVTTDQR
ncbi:hypothetical protein [Neorhodopirellula lusitana]|nr:hypothetical protein [Neorhodopirellula lusitana]